MVARPIHNLKVAGSNLGEGEMAKLIGLWKVREVEEWKCGEIPFFDGKNGQSGTKKDA